MCCINLHGLLLAKLVTCLVTYLHTYTLTYLLTHLFTPWSRVLLEKLTSSQLVKEFPAFRDPKGPLLHLQVPATCPYPEPDQASPRPPSHFLKIHHNTTLPSVPGSSRWSLSHRFPHQNLLYTSPLPLKCYMPRTFLETKIQ